MANRVIFQDPIYQYPNRYRLTDLGSGIYEIQSEPGTITQEGTLLSASNLNATAEEVIFHVLDTSTNANEFLCVINNLTEYYSGLSIILKAKTTNTGVSTINISDVGVKNIKKINESGNKIDLEQNDIIQNKYELLTYDGTDFILSNPAADIATLITDLNNLTIKVNTLQGDINNLKNKVTYFGTSAGTNNAYTLNISGITSYYTGLPVIMVASFNNTASATLNINSLGAKAIKFNGINLNANDIQLNKMHTLIYNGVNFELQPTAAMVARKEIKKIETLEIQDYVTTLEDSVDGYSNLTIKGNTVQNPNDLIDIKHIDSCVIKSVGKNLEEDKIDISPYISGEKAIKGLPNGVGDSIDSDGKLTRRIGKAVFNGTENWAIADATTNTIRFSLPIINLPNIKPGININAVGNIINNNFKNISSSMLAIQDIEGIGLSHIALSIKLLKSKLVPYGYIDANEATRIPAFKSWLQSNPTEIYSEKTTPTTEQLPVKLYLQSFEDGSLVIESPIPPKGEINYPSNNSGAISQVADAVNIFKEETDAKRGDLATLQTTDKTSLVNAVNELFTNANDGKQNWVDVIGSPLVNTDTFATLKSKTQTLKNTMATNLANKGQTASGTESLSSLISKITNVNRIQFGEWNEELNFPEGNKSKTINITVDFKPKILMVYFESELSAQIGSTENQTTEFYWFMLDEINNKTIDRHACRIRERSIGIFYNTVNIQLGYPTCAIYLYSGYNYSFYNLKWIAIE